MDLQQRHRPRWHVHPVAEKPQRRHQGPLAALDQVIEQVEPAIFLFKDFHPFLSKNNYAVIRKLKDIALHLKNSFKTIVLISPVMEIPAELDKEITVINFPQPTKENLGEMLDRIIAEISDRKEIQIDLNDQGRDRLLQAALGLTLGEAENVFAKIIVQGGRLSGEDVNEVFAEKQQIIRKSGLLEYYAASEDFSNVGGLAVLKDWLNKRAVAFTDEARAFGLPAPKGILLLGVQGCGKSLCAKAVSRLWQLPLLRFDMGRMFGSFVGSSEENVRRAIAVAESVAPAILWVDEIDKAFAGSQSSGATDGGTTARVFGTFLTWLSEKTRRCSWWPPPMTFRNSRRNCCARAGWTKFFTWTCRLTRSAWKFSGSIWPSAAAIRKISTSPSWWRQAGISAARKSKRSSSARSMTPFIPGRKSRLNIS